MVFTVIPSLSLKRRSVFSDGLSYPISRRGEMLAIMPPFYIRIQKNHMNSSRFNQTGPKIGLSVRLAETQAEIEAAQRLRYRVFAEELGADIPNTDGRDIDPYDEHCHHLLAFDDATGEVIGCYRLITEETAKKVGGWYSEHEFDLSL